MGIYSVRKEESIIENYIDNVFLEKCLDNETGNLYNKVLFMEKKNWNSLSQLFIEVSESSLTDENKYDIMKEFFDTVEYNNQISESVLLEFQGNETKNQEFIECLKDLEDLIKYFVDMMNKMDNASERLLKISEEVIKSPNKFKQKVQECRNVVKEYNEWYEKASRKINGQVTWRQFDKKVAKFNNKYSQVTMEEKKKLDTKLRSVLKEIDKLVKPWASDGAKVKKVIENIDKLEKIDYDYTKTFASIFGEFNGLLIKEANYTIGDINYSIRKLGIEKENSIVYKVVNKLLK